MITLSRKFSISKALREHNENFKGVELNIFQAVKESVTARQAAEQYGLKISRNGMVCCPFHDDRHPSMKVDKGFCCFACGAKGDVITFVADFFHLAPFEAAKKLAEDFHIPIFTDTIPVILSFSMMLCVTIFIKRKLARPIKLLTNAYSKIENKELDFTLYYPYKDEMGKLCLAFEKMKNCLYQNNQKMIRQFAEQRRLNAAFSHDLRTPLTLLKGHTTMLLSFIPKGLVSQQEVIDELSTMRKNVERLEKYVNAMTNLYRLEDIEIKKETINFNLLLKSLSDTTELLCTDIKYSIKTNCNNNENLFINLDIVVQIYENLLSNSIRYANSMIDIDISMKKQYLLISVSDDGCGFKDSDIERVTLPFYKSSQDTTTEHLGLGLNICKILCERHGGTLKIANNDKGGACVTAWIKIIDVDEK